MSKADALRADSLRALQALDEALVRWAATPTDTLYRDGLIQRFEFCFELAWKTVQAIAADEGTPLRSPKTALAHALRAGWTGDEPLWFRMLEARNLCSHTYDADTAQEVAEQIADFAIALRELLAALPDEPGRG